MNTIMTGTHALSANETGTTNALTVEIEGRLSSPIGGLLRRPIAKAIA